MNCLHSKIVIDKEAGVNKCADCGTVVGHHEKVSPLRLSLVDWRVGDQYACIGNGLFVRTKARKNRRG